MEVSFKARARTLDMLGRQQIAGIPTAVSELFKNAHDANATRVEVDYFRKNGLFVLRDDGFGMSMEEFVDRWLAIATETSLNRKRSNTRRPMNAASARPILGEKGIGRLAIATIAPQALVLTRSLGQGVCSDLTAAFVNWRFFGCPRLNLQDVQIPLRTLPGGELPNGEHVLAMVRQFRTRNEKLREKMDGGDWDKIEADLAKFELDPLDLADILGEPSLLAEGHGTHFYLLPAHSDLIFDIEGEPKSDLASPLQKALLGFTAPSFSTETQPTIRTAFRDHRLDGTCEDLIGEGSFFTRQDFESADHHVYGRFDEYGQFIGSVSVYGNSVDDHVINWSEGKGRRTDCGPFQIQFAAFEGLPGNSRLPPTRHGPMLERTRKLGGLYIYRDGVRIQPYGNTDYDWLEIELRRTKSASYYYFSYRQMFGTVSIDSVHNRKLQEKAGREGFRENKAYRQLRSILKNFLVQVAADFFREEGIHGERLAAQKREFAEDQRHQRARSQTVAAERRKLKKDLSNFFERLETERPLDRVLELGKDTESRVREASDNADFPDAAKRILHIERCALKELDDLEARLAVERPRVGLTRPLQLDWGDYQEAYGELRSRARETRDFIEHVVAEELTRGREGCSINRQRMKVALADTGLSARQQTEANCQNVKMAVEKINDHTLELAQQCRQDLERTIRSALDDFARQDLANMDVRQQTEFHSALEERIREESKRSANVLNSILLQLSAMETDGVSTLVDQIAAVEQSNIALQERVSAELQLVQLGMAIEIINHEFETAIRSIRSGLRILKKWADLNPELASLYGSIRTNFDHLDGCLALFTPLHRRLHRKKVVIRGWEIHEYLTDLFGQRMDRHGVKLTATDAFSKSTIRGYPSSFYPVFVNLVENSIYWLSGQNKRLERCIELDVSGSVFRVSDTGPGIHPLDRDDIFDFGYTRKPGGSGMGLHIARAAMQEIGYDLALERGGPGQQTTFLIQPAVDNDD